MPKVYTAGIRYFHVCAHCSDDILPGQEYRRAGKKKYHHRPDCEHAKSTHAAEPSPIPDESEVRFHDKSRTRLLRCYSGVARVDHDCYECSHSRYANQQMVSTIFAGWQYNAEVWLIHGRLEVRFFHDSCPFNPYEEDMRYEDEEEWDKEEGWEDDALPLAA